MARGDKMADSAEVKGDKGKPGSTPTRLTRSTAPGEKLSSTSPQEADGPAATTSSPKERSFLFSGRKNVVLKQTKLNWGKPMPTSLDNGSPPVSPSKKGRKPKREVFISANELQQSGAKGETQPSPPPQTSATNGQPPSQPLTAEKLAVGPAPEEATPPSSPLKRQATPRRRKDEQKAPHKNHVGSPAIKPIKSPVKVQRSDGKPPATPGKDSPTHSKKTVLVGRAGMAHNRSILKGLGDLCGEEKMCDVTFICRSGKKVHAHSSVLRGVWPLMAEWRDCPYRVGDHIYLSLQDTQHQHVNVLLSIVYTGEAQVCRSTFHIVVNLCKTLGINLGGMLGQTSASVISRRPTGQQPSRGPVSESSSGGQQAGPSTSGNDQLFSPTNKKRGRKSDPAGSQVKKRKRQNEEEKILDSKVLSLPEKAQNQFCYCKAPSSKDLIGCDICPQWYHPRCLKLTKQQVKDLLNLPQWKCPECVKLESVEYVASMSGPMASSNLEESAQSSVKGRTNYLRDGNNLASGAYSNGNLENNGDKSSANGRRATEDPPDLMLELSPETEDEVDKIVEDIFPPKRLSTARKNNHKLYFCYDCRSIFLNDVALSEHRMTCKKR